MNAATLRKDEDPSLVYDYSPTEYKILKILRSHRTWISTSQIADKIYAGRKMPFHGRIFINGSMRNLIRKTKANKDITIDVDRKGELHYRIKS